MGPDSQPPPFSASADTQAPTTGAAGPPPLPLTPPNAKRSSQHVDSEQGEKMGGPGHDDMDNPTYDYARVPTGPAMSQRVCLCFHLSNEVGCEAKKISGC